MLKGVPSCGTRVNLKWVKELQWKNTIQTLKCNGTLKSLQVELQQKSLTDRTVQKQQQTQKSDNTVICCLYQKTKAHRVGLKMYRVQKLYTNSLVIRTYQDNLDFSLCAILSVCCMVVTSDKWMGSKRELSTGSGVSLLNTRD